MMYLVAKLVFTRQQTLSEPLELLLLTEPHRSLPHDLIQHLVLASLVQGYTLFDELTVDSLGLCYEIIVYLQEFWELNLVDVLAF